MKNLRKVIESGVEHLIAENPPPADVGFTVEELRAAAGEFLDILDAAASISYSLGRIADALERIDRQVDLNAR